MISFWVTRSARRGIDTYRQHRGALIGDRFHVRLYDDFCGDVELAHGAQIFAALDQLTPTQREIAARIWDAHMEVAPGAARLNDPRRTRLRFDLLQRLHELGINRFRVWRAADLDSVNRFPVFVRNELDHSGPRSGLLTTREQVAGALRALRLRGHAMRNLMIVEYCDSSGPDGLFRKYSAFKVGPRILPCHAMVARHWSVKSRHNEPDQGSIVEEIGFMATNPHERWLRQVFEAGGVDYGRVDYGVVNGVPQVWEINTNPTLGRASGSRRHTTLSADLQAMRDRGRESFHERLRAAFVEIDAGSDDCETTTVRMEPALLDRLDGELAGRRRRGWLVTRLRDVYDHPRLGGPARFAFSRLFPRR
jgi:hypothetical protein